MANKREILVPDGFYHIYNRAIGNDQLFTTHQEYLMFLNRYFFHSKFIMKTYCYCLLSNHFHFLVKVHAEPELNKNFGLFADDKSRSNNLAQHLGNFFNWYATSYNKKHSRKGSLFIHSFQRKPVRDQQYLMELFCYIHANPLKAGLGNSFNEWVYSSYLELTGNLKYLSNMDRDQVLEWFDGIENFKEVHNQHLINLK